MKLICGWCNKVIRVIDDTPGPDSHGMCARCFLNELTKDGLASARDYLDWRENNAEGDPKARPSEGRDPTLPGL